MVNYFRPRHHRVIICVSRATFKSKCQSKIKHWTWWAVCNPRSSCFKLYLRFQQLVLPVDKGCESRSPVYSRGSRSPSPTDALSSLAPSSSKSPLSSSKIGTPLPMLPSGSGIYVCKGPDPTLHHLQFHPRTRAILEQITGNDKKTQQQQQQHADKIENLGSGGRTLDKEYSYVKFPRRELPHEYSYPKLIDTYREGDDKISSAKSSFKRSAHLPVEKCNSGGSDPGKVSLVLIGSGSSLGSSSNFDSSHSGGSAGDGKRQHQSTSSKKLFLPSEDAKSGLPCPGGSPAKTSLAGLSPMMTLTCAHCRETFCLEDNRVSGFKTFFIQPFYTIVITGEDFKYKSIRHNTQVIPKDFKSCVHCRF